MRNICMTETIYGQSIAGQINNEEEEWQSVARRVNDEEKQHRIGAFFCKFYRASISPIHKTIINKRRNVAKSNHDLIWTFQWDSSSAAD